MSDDDECIDDLVETMNESMHIETFPYVNTNEFSPEILRCMRNTDIPMSIMYYVHPEFPDSAVLVWEGIGNDEVSCDMNMAYVVSNELQCRMISWEPMPRRPHENVRIVLDKRFQHHDKLDEADLSWFVYCE